MKAAAFFLILISAGMAVPPVHAQADQTTPQNFTGEIMDDLCAKDKTHSKMMDQMKSMGTDPVLCSKKCRDLGAKYVLFDRASNTVYPIANQEKVEQFAGRIVRVSGTVDKKKLKVIEIEPSTQTPKQK